MSEQEHEFLDLDGLHGLGWVNSDAPNHIVLNFFAAATDRTEIYNTYVYLLNGHADGADVQWKTHFPDIVTVEQKSLPENPQRSRKWMKIVFERGYISFVYERACLQRQTTKLQFLRHR
jgi:hypothetical protein